ncbi:MAG: 4'-phosphopantetheinyl transferase superfamily protein [Clostridia bacterium]|nr:4'-phosphopantetheinyl transferase superfamily protein [Clostridia bacterium]
MTDIFIAHAEKYRDAEAFGKAFAEIPECRKAGIESMNNPSGKRLLLATGIALARALSSRGIDPLAADIRKTKQGKPYISRSRKVFFSLSHSGDLGVCAVSGCANGVDAERTGRANAGIAARFFTPHENKYLAAAPDYDYCFTRLWTLKESFSKYVGVGIAAFRNVEIDMRKTPPVVAKSEYDCSPRLLEFTYGEYQIALCTDDADGAKLIEI